MALSTIVKSAIDGTITLNDGTAVTPLSVALTFDNGDLSISGLAKTLNEVVAIQGRGKHRSVRLGARSYPTLSFTAHVSQLTAAADDGPVTDMVLGQGVYSAAVSTSSGDVYTLDLTYDIEGTDLGDSADQQIVINDIHCTVDFSESMDGSTVSISGTIYGAITGDIAAAGLT